MLEALDREVDNQDLAGRISQDPSIAAGVLRAANAALFAPVAGRIESVADAVARIGRGPVRQLVMAIGVIREVPAGGFDAEQFWVHSLTSGLAVRILAERCALDAWSRSRAESGFFTLGLLHDVGVLVLAETLGESYRELLKANQGEHRPLFCTELDRLGFHHGDVGATLLSDWGLGEDLVESVRWHHEPAAADARFQPLPSLLHLADWMAHHLGHGRGPDGAVERFDEAPWYDLGLDFDCVPELLEALEHAARECRAIVSLAG